MADSDRPTLHPQRSGGYTISTASFGVFLLMAGLFFLQTKTQGAGLIGLLVCGAGVFLLNRAVSSASRRSLLLIGVILLLPGLGCLIMLYEGIMRSPTDKQFTVACLMVGGGGIAIICWALGRRRS